MTSSPVKVVLRWSGAAAAAVLMTAVVSAQTPPDLVLAYPDMIVHNGKVVSMDDPAPGTGVGTTAQALAVRNGEVLLMGSNEAVLALKGPKTQVIDLRGR